MNINSFEVEALLAGAEQARAHGQNNQNGSEESQQQSSTQNRPGNDFTTGAFPRARPYDLSNLGPRDRYSSEREENDERRSRRSKEIVDGDTRGGSDRESANGSTRSRKRSRSPPHSSSYHRGGHYNGKDDRYRPGQRSGDDDHRRYRARSPLRLDRPRDSDERGGRPRGRGGRDSSPPSDSRSHAHGRDRSRNRSRDRSRHRDREDGDRQRGSDDRNRQGRGKRTPEPSNEERDQRTVFIQQIANRVRTKELSAFFEQAGAVVEAQIVKDRITHRSKGVGYVEFKDEESAKKAINLTGHKLCGIPLIVGHTEAEKNRQVRATADSGSGPANGAPYHRLYVGNIHFSVGEEQLKEVFGPFGELEQVTLQTDENGRSKGYGFVQYSTPQAAKDALEALNGMSILDRPMRVGLGSDKFGADAKNQAANRGEQGQGSSFSGMGGRGTHAGGSSTFGRAGGRTDRFGGGASALDDSDISGGVQFSNVDRYSLMSKLARTDKSTTESVPQPSRKKPPVEHPTATRCILLKHCYDQATESGDSWQDEIRTDIQVECENKFGKVVHIALALDSNDGEVYIKFEDIKSGEKAIQSLNGRFFGSRRLTASYVVEVIYNTKYPRAANV